MSIWISETVLFNFATVVHMIYNSRLKMMFTQNCEALLHCRHWEDYQCGMGNLFFFPPSGRFGTFLILPIHWNVIYELFSIYDIDTPWYFPKIRSSLFCGSVFVSCLWPRPLLSTVLSVCSFWNSYYLDVGPPHESSNFLNFSTLLVSLIILLYILRDFLNYMFLLFYWIF